MTIWDDFLHDNKGPWKEQDEYEDLFPGYLGIPRHAQACPDLLNFTQNCLGAILTFVMVENDFKVKITMFLDSFNEFPWFYPLFYWYMLPRGALGQWGCFILWILISI